MDKQYLVQLHEDLCNWHNDLSDKIVAMSHTDVLYRQANTTADSIYAAAQEAYKLLRYNASPVT